MIERAFSTQLIVLGMLASVGVFCVSCAANRTMGVQEMSSRGTGPQARPVRVAGYTTTDGHYHRFDGRLEMVGDSVRFVIPAQRAHGMEVAVVGQVVTVPRDQVLAVNLRRTNIPASILLGASVLFLFGAIAVGVLGIPNS